MDEAAYRRLISGGDRGLARSIQRGALGAISAIYGTAVRLRSQAFDYRVCRIIPAPVPVISIGNITTGGTGKTPMVAWMVQRLQQRGLKPVILSRGYRALAGEANDEKLVLDQLCPGVPHVQNPDRVAASRVAVEEHGAEVLVLDDGFQHRRLARDLDVVLIDALNPFGYGHLLPRGLLREPLAGLRRADLIVITRADQVDDVAKRSIVDQIAGIRGTADHAEVAFSPECLVNSTGRTDGFGSLVGRPVTAFCGIGNPGAFEGTIADCGLRIADCSQMGAFPDHHHYADADLQSIVRSAKKCSAAAIVATQKDLVKINRDELDGIPLWAIRIGTEILSGADLIHDHLQRVLPGSGASNRG